MPIICNEQKVAAPTEGLGDTYETLVAVKIPDAIFGTTVTVKNVDSTNNLTFKIGVSNDPAGADTSFADFPINADLIAEEFGDSSPTEQDTPPGTTYTRTIPNAYQFLRVQAKRTAAGTPKADIAILASR